MKRKIYKLLASSKQGLFALALTVFSVTAYAQTTYTFSYTGAVQTINLPAGSYSIECWGAIGGWHNSDVNLYRGRGGYSSGTITLTASTNLYIGVGGAGGTQLSNSVPGGWNGGGNGKYYSYSYNGGGGASHVATVTGVLSTLASNQSAVLLVAGGGAGGCTGVTPGNGGGLNGGNSTRSGCTGGTQSTPGGSSITGGNALFGQGWDASLSGGSYGGGGGGWYGGGCESGGSSYIGGVSGGTTIMFGQAGYVTNPDVSGNGLVLIKELCNISLSSITGSSINAICSGGSATLTTNAISNYSWSTGATTSSIVVSPASATLYSLTATSPSNCTASAVITISVDAGVPALSIANTASATGGICPTKTVMLTASGASSYTWTGASPTITNGVVFAPTIAGTYTVTGINGCGTTTAAVSLSVHPFPTVSPVASSSSLCSGSSLTLTGVGNSTAYAWSGGSGGITNGVGFTPALTATYTVIGTSALSCTASATIPVTVVATPISPPTAQPALICTGGSSTLTASGATSYTWASATQTVFTSTFIVTPNIGTTTYTVTKANANCVDVKQISVVTNSLPTIFAIVTPTLVCALNPATLAVGGAQTYTWTAPGPPTFTFTGASPVVSPPVSSIYTVAASDGTCINTTTVFLATNPNPTITTTASSPSICVGQSVTINANGGINYTWTASGSTNTLYTQSITDSPVIATAYNVSADNSFGCVSGASQIVLVYPNPTITISATKTLVCNNGASTLTASGAHTYSWDPNANGAFTPGTVVYATNISTGPVIYTVAGSYSNTGCSSTKTVQVVVFIPTLSVSGNTNTCAGGLINLVATGGNNNTYSWNTGVGTPYNFSSISNTIAAPTIWTLTANTTSASVICPSTLTIPLGLFYNPTITTVAQRTTICKNESVELMADGGVTYTWSTNMSGTTITVTPGSGTFANYTVTGTDANGCVNTGTVQVKISGCAGINELNAAQAGLNVYPNPNNGEFVIEATSALKLTLVNELGQLIRVIDLSGTNNYKVSVTDLAQGIYFISGQKDNVQINQKVVITK